MRIIGSIYPALIGEDPTKHAAAVAESRSFSYNGRRHWVVPSNTDTHDNAADHENNANDHYDHFLSVDKPSAEGITQETERELSNNITDICCRIHCASKEEWIGRALLSLQTSPISVLERCQCKPLSEKGTHKEKPGTITRIRS